jgi:large subunit ribosomal protein L2
MGDKYFYNIAVQGLEEGQDIIIGKNAEIKPGNILSLSSLPIGTNLSNIELTPFSGGKLVRSSGLSAVVTKKLNGKVTLLLPSKKERLFDENVRATIGIVAGAGRTEKPFVKAGRKWHLMKARNKLYPRTSPIKMNALNHPFGGGRGKNMGKSSIAPRFAPAGRKVGLLRPRKTGRGK